VRLADGGARGEPGPAARSGAEVDVAFVQGGADPSTSRADPTTRAAITWFPSAVLFHEPVWLFYRGDAAERLVKAPQLTALSQLAGWRVNIGAPEAACPT
jgi:hypothetical protein